MQNPTEHRTGTDQATTRRSSASTRTATRGGSRTGARAVAPAASLRERRYQLKRTQEEAAAGIGVSLSTYQRWERGEQTPHLRAQRRLADYLGVDFAAVDRWFPADEPEGAR
jgi:DNA-binding XRE family transcriptional regulator